MVDNSPAEEIFFINNINLDDPESDVYIINDESDDQGEWNRVAISTEFNICHRSADAFLLIRQKKKWSSCQPQ